jgi:hypothetical protein
MQLAIEIATAAQTPHAFPVRMREETLRAEKDTATAMNINEAFPSKYLKATDLQGRRIEVIMADVKTEKLGDDFKPILSFKGKDKGLVLNKTNSNTIIDAYGPETDEWFGQPIILFETMVEFQGKRSPAIRVAAPVRPRQEFARRAQEPDRVSNGAGQHQRDEWASQPDPGPAQADPDDGDVPF